MFVTGLTLAMALATLFIKWFTTVAETRKRAQLAEVIEEHARLRQRLKLAVGAISIVDSEIAKLQRSIRSRNRKIPSLEQELKKLAPAAQGQAEMARQKLVLSEQRKTA